MMIDVRIDADDLYEMLMNRLKTWTDNEDTIELFEQFYDHRCYGGCFDGCELNIMSIVDNDYVNNTWITTCEEYTEKRNEYLRDEIKRFIEEEKDTYEDKEDYILDLKLKIEDLKEEAPEFDDLETGENNLEFLNGEYIEAKTDNSILLS